MNYKNTVWTGSDWTGDLSKDVNKMMETFFGPDAVANARNAANQHQLKGKITKSANGPQTISFLTQGCQRTDFEVKIIGNLLVISLTKGNVHTPAFSEQYVLQTADDIANISASCENGVLVVTVPTVKAQSAANRTIPVV